MARRPDQPPVGSGIRGFAADLLRPRRWGRRLDPRQDARAFTFAGAGLALISLGFLIGFALGSGRTDAPLPTEIVVEAETPPLTATARPSVTVATASPAPSIPTPETVIEYRERLVYVYVYIKCAIVGARASILSIETQERIASEAGLVHCPQ